ncbi:MAG: SDR family NAD(P)-dependent oxidoreductase, partial [Alphaproteobacteria bacterium]|nr:SDR family NAD(P)-dependent oxidoreductase [Alphaproteobacteria bacterium]
MKPRIVSALHGKDDEAEPGPRLHPEATAAQKREGFEAVGFTADVGVEREAEAIVQQAMNVFGLIDILVNNAGNAIGGLLW